MAYFVNDNPSPQGLRDQLLKRFQANKVAVVSLAIIVVACVLGMFAELLAPFPYDEPHVSDQLLSPNSTYWMGTDSLGRDLFSRIIHGAQISMTVGIVTALISLIIGVAYGSISGWLGGKTDFVLMGIVDALYSIPTVVLLILIKVFFDAVQIFDDPKQSALLSILLALSLVGWVTLARVVRGQVLQLKKTVFVEASISMGARGYWIILKHIFPNMLGAIFVLLTYQIPSNILFESFLSFIGLGLQPPYSSWGVLANDGWRSLRSHPHLIVFPGMVLCFVVLAFNLLGDELRDLLDPKTRKK